jgi:hypothetical protein
MEQLSDLIPLVRWHVYALQSGDKKHILESGNQLDRWLRAWDEQEEVRGVDVARLAPIQSVYEESPGPHTPPADETA